MNIEDKILRLSKQKGFTMQAKQHENTISRHEHVLTEKIRTLPPSRITEVEDFIDFLRQSNEDRRLTKAATTLSEKAFQQIWDNPEDADYDDLTALRNEIHTLLG